MLVFPGSPTVPTRNGLIYILIHHHQGMFLDGGPQLAYLSLEQMEFVPQRLGGKLDRVLSGLVS